MGGHTPDIPSTQSKSTPLATNARLPRGEQQGTPTMLLTVAEVERELRLGRTRVYQLLRAGEIRSVRVGERAIRVTRDDLHKWIGSRQELAG